MRRSLAIEKAVAKSNAPIAYIRLRGRWLRDAGFEPGTRVEIRPIAFGALELRACPAPAKNPMGLRPFTH